MDEEMFADAIHAALTESPGKDAIKDAIEIPKDRSHGDLAFPCFMLAKLERKPPQQIAQELAEKLAGTLDVEAEGPYVNLTFAAEDVVGTVLRPLLADPASFGKGDDGDVILVESPGPNTNKPLHLGHLRNILLGDSIARMLAFRGNDVHIVNVVNDRGVHICKSMLAYQKTAQGETPEQAGRKPDHFVGDMYVRYTQLSEKHPEYEQEIQDMLVRWEEGDPEVLALWKRMNAWALSGFQTTYDRLGFSIEKEYYESETYKGGRDIIMDGLKKGIFEKDEEGAVIIDLDDEELGKKVLLRSNGTALYITQDINMARLRYDDFHFDQMIYVVGNEQQYHFKVLFEVFKRLGWSFADACKHFSYGMVELPEGKMKSREGTVVDADNLLDEVESLAEEEVRSRYKNLSDEEVERRSRVIGHGAIRFFILKNDALRNFVYDPKASLSFEGETGPYVQYTYARIASILRKGDVADMEDADLSLLNLEQEKHIAQVIADYPDMVARAAEEMRPNLLCHYLVKLCKEFNSYYVNTPVLKNTENLKNARCALITGVKEVLASGLGVLGIDVLEQM